MSDRLIRFLRARPNVMSRAFRISAIGAVTAGVGFAAACGDLTGIDASLSTITDSGTVYSINGAPPGAPTALYIYSGTRLAADASFIFDVAFDLNSNGSVTILPQSTVASGLVTTHTVALQKTTQAFDEITSAPRDGYHADTAVTVGIGEVVLAQTTDPNVCSVSFTGTALYAKIVVVAVDPAKHSIDIRYTVDPNCGFRSFGSGIPKD